MKILAVRGKNLASLAGSFELDLERPPLGGVGLFVIAGPTGAGKSTILDALCLALFDRTPRLRGRGGAVCFVQENDREVLSSGDPRCLMRRGASEAQAEVDFVGSDGRRWRATWSVRRAHRRPDGRIQPQTVKLVDLDTEQQFGGTKTQTLEAIELALGLDYTGFCRSVLLAQGEFASFLKARPDERADLLERMTGTSLYGVLSIAAHRRAAEERQALQLVEVQLRSLSHLDATTRAELDAAHEAQWAQLEAARADLASKQRDRRWHEQLQTLRSREASAQADLQAAKDALEEGEALRVELRTTSAARAFAEPVGAHDRAADALGRAAALLAELTRSAHEAGEHQATQQATLAAADAQRLRAETVQAERQPEVDRARALDLTIAQAREAAEAAAERHAKARGDEQSARERSELGARELTRLAERRAAATAWLEAHAADATLAQQWPRWEALLRRLTDLLESRPARLTQRQELKAERTAAEATLAERTEEARLASEREQAAEAFALEAEEGASQAFGGRDLKAAREELDDRRVTLAELRTVLLRAGEANKSLERAGREEASAREEIEAASAAELEAQAQGLSLEGALLEAERAAREARLALGLEDQRHELRDDHPCPLCGATEHPYKDEVPAFSLFVREREQRVEDLRSERSQQREAAEGARVRRHHAKARALAARAKAVGSEEERDKAEEVWLDLGFKLGWKLGQDLPPPWDPKAGETLGWLEDGTRQQLVIVRRLQDEVEQGRQGLATARQEHALAQQRLAASDKLAEGVRHRWDLLEQALMADGELERRLTAELSEACARDGWKDALRADPSAFLAGRQAAQERYQRHGSQEREARESAARLEPEVIAAHRRAQELGEVLRVASVEVQRLDELLALHRAERAGLCDGRDATAFQEELAAAVRAARDEQDAARAATQRARQARSAAAAKLEVAAQEEERLQSVAAQAARALEAALDRVGVDLPTMRERLSRTAEWVEERRATLADLDRRRTELQRTVVVLAAHREEHEAQGAVEGDLDAAVTLEATARAAVVAAEATLLDVRARLSADDTVLERATRLEAELETQRAASELWTKLGDLIGSHDGKKFRVFAQSLTLEILLDRANLTLKTLAPRYRLQRVMGQDLDLEVVDLDMAGEVRAVSSLSGGESFLVSLSLALGLSSLSSRDTQVDSLFVDEGFGSLDPDSQELAISTLDALQATGRQVALISHIPGLTDRIGVGVQVVPQGQGKSRVLVS